MRKVVSEGIRQITLDDRRWYQVDDKFLPSATWILEYYPKGARFAQWLADIGSWSESREILVEAGDRGSRVHWAIEELLNGITITPDSVPYGYHLPLTAKEWRYILAFVNWWEKYNPLVLDVERTIVGAGYAGTADLICIIDGGLLDGKEADGDMVRCLVDWKTSASLYESYKCQVAAYAMAEDDIERVFLCRLGSKHKAGYEFKEVKDVQGYFNIFQSVYDIWRHENDGAHPRFMEVPEILSLIEDTEEVEI